MTKPELLKVLNNYLWANSKSRRLQRVFEEALADYNGIERDELSEVMDIYIDMDIAAEHPASMSDLEKIIEQSVSSSRYL